MNRFNAHCWRCQPTADVCNASELIATTPWSTTEAWAATTETSNETDAEHRLVLQPIEARYTIEDIQSVPYVKHCLYKALFFRGEKDFCKKQPLKERLI